MRNLKKVLSLALALVMLLGMMVVGAGAAAPGDPGEPPVGAPGAADEDKTTTYADLTDNGEIQNADAVSLMVDLGIINGVPQEDGTVKYEPAQTVDRATMSKLIFYVLTGEDDATPYEGIDTGLTDVDDSWAKGFINYCYGTKLIAGDGLGHFFPKDTLNVAQGAKMLLTALGYDADSCGFQGVGEDWAINVMTYANKAGLLKGLKKLSAVDDLSRDNAAQMVFNALNAKTVTVDDFTYVNGKRVVTKYAEGETLGYESYGLIKVTATVAGIDDKGNIVMTGATAEDVSVQSQMGKVKLPGTADMVGGTVTFYAQGKIAGRDKDGNATGVTVDGAISSAATPTVSNVLATSMDGTSMAKLTTRTDRDFKAELEEDGEEVLYYINGKASNAEDVAAAVDKSGVIVELVDTDGNGLADVVRVTQKTVATVSADPTTRTGKDGDEIRILGVVGWTSIDKVVVEGTEELQKGDVVLWYATAGVTYIEKAVSVEGVVTGVHSRDGLELGGKYYDISGLTTETAAMPAGVTKATWKDFKNDFKFYLDDAENIVKIVASGDTDTETESTYAIVREVAWFEGSGFNPNGHMEARLLFTDGTTKTVEVASVDGVVPIQKDYEITTTTTAGEVFTLEATTLADASTNKNTQTLVDVSGGVAPKTVANANKFYLVSSGEGAAATNKVTAVYFGVDNDTPVLTALVTNNQFYEYEEDNGVYTLKNVPAAGLAKVAITNGKAAFDGTNVGNANTVFIFDKGANKTPDIYVGIANVPSTSSYPSNNVTDHSNLHTIVKDASGIAKFVFVQGATVANTSADVVYLYETAFTTVDGGKVVNAFINGEPGTIKIASNKTLADTTNTNQLKAPALYAVESIDDKGVYTLASAANGGSADNPIGTTIGIKSTAGDALVLGDGTGHTYDENTVVYVFATEGPRTTCNQVGIADLALDASDEVYVVADSDGYAVTVYVVKVDAPKPAMTLGKGTANGTEAISVASFAPDAATASAVVNATQKNIKVSATVSGEYDVAYELSGNALVGAAPANYAGGDLAVKAGTLNVKVIVTDRYSKAVETYNYTVTVTEPSAGDASVTVSITGTTATATFDAGTSGLTAASYAWSSATDTVATVSGTTTSGTITQTYAAEAGNSSKITVTVTLSNGATVSGEETYTVAAPKTTGISVAVSINTSTKVATATVTDSNDSGLTVSSYAWSSSETGKATIAANDPASTATIADVAAGNTNITVEITLSNGGKVTSTAQAYTASNP